MPQTIEKCVRLSEERARQLGILAAQRKTTEDALVERALDMLFALTEGSAAEERRFWSALSGPAFARIWDNPKDAEYDNWRELYGVPEG